MMYSAFCFIVFLWILLHRGSAQLLDVNCGTVSHHDEHLISDSPWMALIILPNKTCSGTLIHKRLSKYEYFIVNIKIIEHFFQNLS